MKSLNHKQFLELPAEHRERILQAYFTHPVTVSMIARFGEAYNSRKKQDAIFLKDLEDGSTLELDDAGDFCSVLPPGAKLLRDMILNALGISGPVETTAAESLELSKKLFAPDQTH